MQISCHANKIGRKLSAQFSHLLVEDHFRSWVTNIVLNTGKDIYLDLELLSLFLFLAMNRNQE
jgi:hypothetical protein